MGISMHVVGFKPPDEKWKKMKAVYDACCEADTVTPPEVAQFFNYDPPDESGVRISEKDLRNAGAVEDWDDDTREGFEINLDKIPKDVKVIRFYCSY